MTLQKFLASRTGKRLYNLCYCWGACLVILGAVSKIAYLPYSNLFLMVGLAVEVFIFFISGFDEPSREYKWERVFPILNDKAANIDPKMAAINFGVPNTGMTAQPSKEEIARMQENIKQLNDAYEKQLEALRSMPQTDLSENMQQMAANIKMLNKQYKQMLDVFNVNTDK